MTLEEETRVLGEELERLDERLDELTERLDNADADTASAQVIRSAANDIDTQGGAVAYLVEEYGADATITVRGLAAGEYARVEDRTAAMRAEADGVGSLPGSSRNVFVAAGLVDAPFYEGDPDDLDAKLAEVTSQPVGVVTYLEALINDLTTVSEGNWTRLAER